MATYRITAPDGTKLRFEGPDGATDEEVRAYAETQWKPQATKPVEAAPEKSTAQNVVDFIRPTVEGAGAIGGGLIGTALGPAGTVGGAGLGYGIAKGGLRLIDQYLGTEKAPTNALQGLGTAANDVLTGATMEVGGQVAAPYISKGLGWFADKFSTKTKAANIARQALGPDLEAAKNALKLAPEGETAAQATANINSPTWQALNSRAAARDPRFYGGGPLTPVQEAGATNALTGIAGGTTQTQAISAREAGKQALRDRLIPTLDTELAAANTAGQLKPKFDAEAQRMADAAASKVQDVRRFTDVGERAAKRAANTTTVPGLPQAPGRYTYMGELEKKAEQVAQQAANASLPFGEASKFAQAASDSLAAHGLKPLTVDSIVSGIRKTLANPEFAGNKDIERVLLSVGDDIAKWTQNGGIIDGRALDSIRKNSVNTAVNQLSQGMEPAAAKQLAANVSRRIAPMIEDAITNAGGTGYKQYLQDFAQGRQLIDQQKLGAKALELFKTNKPEFVRLVEGNSPDTVNKIFGLNKEGYDIAKQMSAEAMSTMSGVADLTSRGAKAAEQATLGQEALKKVINDNLTRFKIPWGLSPKTMAMNRALDVLEHKAGTKTMNILAEGMKSGKSAEELLSYLPAKERVNLLRVLQDPGTWAPGASGAAVNALAQ